MTFETLDLTFFSAGVQMDMKCILKKTLAIAKKEIVALQIHHWEQAS